MIGAGKFGSMYLSQIPTTPGIHLLGIADLSPDRARENLARLGWKPDVTAATSFADARKHGSTYLTDDWRALVSHPEIDIVVEVDRRSDRCRRTRARSLPQRQAAW